MPNNSELELVDWIQKQYKPFPGVLIPPGDDAGVMEFPGGKPCVVTTDMLLEGSCFLLDEAGPTRVGTKAIHVNLSDIAAMAAEPKAALISLALPRNASPTMALDLMKAMKKAADAFETVILGGDTNSWNGPLAINVTLMGVPGPQGPVTRSGAKVGDSILVTGPLGGSILGHHLDFIPRVREALQLADMVPLHAMMDISDGLALDLHRMCSQSKCGAILQADKIPISHAALAMKDDKSPLVHALGDGEDFELVFTTTPEKAKWLLANQPVKNCQLYEIGKIVEKGIFLEENGRKVPLEPLGYTHGFAWKSGD